MKNLFILSICAVLIFTAFKPQSPSDFLHGLNYEFSENYSKKEFTIPKEFDMVYNNYNEIQKEAGFDLTDYKGKECVMYTYEIYNHPFGKCNVNIIMYKGEIIGGDISSVNLDGFMVPLI